MEATDHSQRGNPSGAISLLFSQRRVLVIVPLHTELSTSRAERMSRRTCWTITRIFLPRFPENRDVAPRYLHHRIGIGGGFRSLCAMNGSAIAP